MDMFGVCTLSVRAKWVGSRFWYNIFFFNFQRFPELVQQHTVERWLPMHACCINGHVHVMELLLKYPYPPHLMQKFRWVWVLSRHKRHGVIFVCSLCRVCSEWRMERRYLLGEDYSLLVYDVVFFGDIRHSELHVVLSVFIPVILILQLTWVTLHLFQNMLF